MRKIGAGHKSEVYVLADGRILKLFVPQFTSLAPVEAEISRVLERAGVEAPRLAEIVQIDGRPGIVFDNLPAGETLSHAVRVRPWRIASYAHQLARLHAAVHECSSNELPSQRERLESEIDSARGLPDGVQAAALRALSRLPYGNAVCHNDIHMLNVIVHPQGAMLIDWVLATRGNPLADVAAAILQLQFGERPGGLVAGTALEAGRALFWRAYLRRYLRLCPVNRRELKSWELPIAVALAGRREGRMRRQLIRRIERLAGRLNDHPAVVRS